MKALVIDEPGKTTLVERDCRAPGPGEVLLRVRKVGFCGSDLSTFRGINPLVTYPRVPGHEVAGTIETLGDQVPSQFAVGQHVLVLPYSNCGSCSACQQNRPNCCQHNETLGVQRDGAMSEFFVAPWEKLMSSPKLSLEELALVEPLTVGFHAIDRGRVTSNDTVAVFGCGAIGLGVIAGAKARDATVIAIDIDDSKLSLAKSCGAKETINSQKQPLHESLQELTEGRGPDVIVEAVGAPATFRSAVEEVCFAGRVVYIGYAKSPVEYDSKYFVMKELDILGSRNAAAMDFQAVIKVLEAKQIPTDSILSANVPLSEAGKILQEWSDDPARFTKIQVDFDS